MQDEVIEVTPEATPAEKQKLAAFVRPDSIALLGRTFRPYVGNTALIMEQVRLPLKFKLQKLIASNCLAEDATAEKWLSNMATYWYLAAFLYVHGAPIEEVKKVSWDIEQFTAKVTDFIAPWSFDEILSCVEPISDIVNRAHTAGNFQVEATGDESPNS